MITQEPESIQQYFRMAQAAYRSQAIHTTGEWRMATPEGRESYKTSMEREAFLEKLNGAREALTRAEERLSVVPFGSVIYFDSLMYRNEVQ